MYDSKNRTVAFPFVNRVLTLPLITIFLTTILDFEKHVLFIITDSEILIFLKCVRFVAFTYRSNVMYLKYYSSIVYGCSSVCEVGTVGQISDCQPEVPWFNPRTGRWLNFVRPSFATPSVDRDVKPLV